MNPLSLTNAKAIGSGLAALVGSLLLVINGNETFSDVTTAEWLLVILNTLGSYGVTWVLPNKPPAPPAG